MKGYGVRIPQRWSCVKALGKLWIYGRLWPPSSNGYQVERKLVLCEWLQLQNKVCRTDGDILAINIHLYLSLCPYTGALWLETPFILFVWQVPTAYSPAIRATWSGSLGRRSARWRERHTWLGDTSTPWSSCTCRPTPCRYWGSCPNHRRHNHHHHHRQSLRWIMGKSVLYSRHMQMKWLIF